MSFMLTMIGLDNQAARSIPRGGQTGQEWLVWRCFGIDRR